MGTEDHWSDFGWSSNAVTDLVKILIKVHPSTKFAQVRMPNAETQQLYVSSVVTTLHVVHQILTEPKQNSHPFTPQWPKTAVGGGPAGLPNFNLDTGALDQPRTYGLTGDAYFSLLNQVAVEYGVDSRWPLPSGLKGNLISYFDSLKPMQARDFFNCLPGAPGDLSEVLTSLNKVSETGGCPDKAFGMANIGFVDPSPPDVPIPSLCDETEDSRR